MTTGYGAEPHNQAPQRNPMAPIIYSMELTPLELEGMKSALDMQAFAADLIPRIGKAASLRWMQLSEEQRAEAMVRLGCVLPQWQMQEFEAMRDAGLTEDQSLAQAEQYGLAEFAALTHRIVNCSGNDADRWYGFSPAQKNDALVKLQLGFSGWVTTALHDYASQFVQPAGG